LLPTSGFRKKPQTGLVAYPFQLDVTQKEDWQSVPLESCDVGEVDIVVNNAGYFPNRSIDDLDLPTWRKTITTNLDSHFLSAKPTGDRSGRVLHRSQPSSYSSSYSWLSGVLLS
jgi:NAD(P)-dependent dehydrogenase (short-subunit alcohol dehydrogenase family)